VIKNGSLLPAPFVTLTVDPAGERGLLGVAFDPDFASTQYVYVYYTVPGAPAHNRLSRFRASGDVAVAGSEQILLELNALSSATNHNGGAIHFAPAPDGKLYVAVGDNANGANAQTLGNLLGKILRLNADGTIPTDNPFYGTATGANRAIWALGLRNPFTFAFEAQGGRLFVNDVGQSTWEEIDEGAAGANYGWPTTEGPTTDPRFVSSYYAYRHSSGSPTGCAISGGAFYSPLTAQFPADYTGDYFFADYCSGWIYRIDTSGPSGVLVTPAFATGIPSPVDLHVAEDGSLYYLARGSGSSTGVLVRVTYTAAQSPTITTQPASVTVAVGQSATFTVAASGSSPLAYQWQRNQANIPGATSPSYTLSSPQLADSGSRFRCVVSNGAGTATSSEATLTVISNTLPVPRILQPPVNRRYAGGETIAFSGSATDAEDGTLPPSAFTWEVVFHHDTHTHPFLGPIAGVTSGSFTIPTTGETASNVWYRVRLTVTDSAGQTATIYRDVLPRTIRVTLYARPGGLSLTLDGQPVTAPYTFVGVAGIERAIGTTSPQTRNGITYDFVSWSDGGAQTHTIAPVANATFTATFARR
jgi:glucose/arabinose dehydrogenase